MWIRRFAAVGSLTGETGWNACSHAHPEPVALWRWSLGSLVPDQPARIFPCETRLMNRQNPKLPVRRARWLRSAALARWSTAVSIGELRCYRKAFDFLWLLGSARSGFQSVANGHPVQKVWPDDLNGLADDRGAVSMSSILLAGHDRFRPVWKIRPLVCSGLAVVGVHQAHGCG